MKRPTLLLIGMLVVLCGAAYLVMMRPGEQSLETGAGELIAQIDSALVDRIDIVTPASHLVLERRGIVWYVSSPVDAKADHQIVAGILSRARMMRSIAVVSSKPEKHGVFQVDSTGTQVVLYQGQQEAAAFVVGKASASFAETFVRRKNSNDVMTVEGSLGWMFSRSVKDWRDKTILNVPRAEIQRVQFQYGDTTFSLAFRDSVWTLDNRQPNASAVDAFLSAISSFQCDDFAESAPAGKPLAMITAGETQLRFVFDKASSRYQVQSSASPQWYVVESWRANQILKRKKELL